MVYNGRWKSNQSKSHYMHTQTHSHTPMFIHTYGRYLWLIRRFTLLGCASYQTACRSGFPAQCLVISNIYIAVYLSYQNGLNLSTLLMKLVCQKQKHILGVYQKKKNIFWVRNYNDENIAFGFWSVCDFSVLKRAVNTHTHTYMSYTRSQSLAIYNFGNCI